MQYLKMCHINQEWCTVSRMLSILYVFCALFVGHNPCSSEPGKWPAPLDLDFCRTSGVYIAISQNPLKRWENNKWLEWASDPGRSVGNRLISNIILFTLLFEHLIIPYLVVWNRCYFGEGSFLSCLLTSNCCVFISSSLQEKTSRATVILRCTLKTELCL